MMLVKICNRAIEYLFYALFFFVPLIFLPVNSELFEFNKMLFTYAITVLIGGFWAAKMIRQRQIAVQRTPLDIPIFLFLASQIIATIVSIDVHTSIWGYYSRSNGGLASILSYIFLYYAFVSNFPKEKTKRLLFVALISGILVAVYGVLERLGIDKDFWVQDVQNRVFSTLGQPNWLAAYLSVLIPISVAFGLNVTRDTKHETRKNLLVTCYMLLVTLFYATLLFTKSRSGFLGFLVGFIFFFGALHFFKDKSKKYVMLNTKYIILPLFLFIGITFIFGTPFEQLNRFTLQGLQQPATNDQRLTTKPQGPALEVGGTESGEIRKIVWKGAIEIAKAYPLFGSGVETFAYSYYKFRPVEHNNTSEWDFLYNKAHNEYLNYLANTGIVGLGSYLLMIGAFLFLTLRYLNTKYEIRNTKQYQNTNDRKSKRLEHSDFENSNLLRVSIFDIRILTIALLSGYISILISNFFGFSVVVTNLFLLLIPGWVFLLAGKVDPQSAFVFPPLTRLSDRISNTQLIGILFVALISYLSLFYIFRMWDADRNFALGTNYNREGEYTLAYSELVAALRKRGSEPQFSDEMSTTTAALAITAFEQNESTLSAQLVNETVRQSNLTIAKSPNNPNFWRTRIRVFYMLAQLDETYTQEALTAAKRAVELSPTDPKVVYNYGLILGQMEKLDEAIAQLEEAQRLKPDYLDPIYALGLFYHEAATDEKGRVVNQAFFDKAILQMENVLKLASDHAEAKENLKQWRGLP